jgi:hypothetical protein
MEETRAARRLKIKRYRVLIGKLGAKNRARERLQALIDEMEVQQCEAKDRIKTRSPTEAGTGGRWARWCWPPRRIEVTAPIHPPAGAVSARRAD